jgi:dTDP-glucose pyrophosphorylase/predicted transcriptional regulator
MYNEGKIIMKNWKSTLITPSTQILEAMRIIENSAMQIALVVDDKKHLIGVVTDGDIRRGILRGLSLEKPVEMIMNRHFTTICPNAQNSDILSIMKQKVLRQIPVVDDSGCVVDLKIIDDIIQLSRRENWVILMAGGLGSRLKPLTDDCPKPMLNIGGKPILERVLDNFIEYGYRKFYISVNYRAEMIESYFNDGLRWSVDIRYLRENMPMGTAGALSLLTERPSVPIIVMNGDVLTKVNMQHLLDFHEAHKSKATMCVHEYDFQVPYGVITTNQYRLAAIDEKPIQRFFVNAGIYVLEPDMIDHIPKNEFFNMTTLFETVISLGYETAAFPIHEYWLDIGRIADFQKANYEFNDNFANETDK